MHYSMIKLLHKRCSKGVHLYLALECIPFLHRIKWTRHGNNFHITGLLCRIKITAWWRHSIETFSALLRLYDGKPQVPGVFPHNGQYEELICFLWSAPELVVEAIKTPMFETPSRLLWLRCSGSPVDGPNKRPATGNFDMFLAWTNCWTPMVLILYVSWDY